MLDMKGSNRERSLCCRTFPGNTGNRLLVGFSASADYQDDKQTGTRNIAN